MTTNDVFHKSVTLAMLAFSWSMGTAQAQSAACESMVELCGRLDTLVALDAPFDLDGAESIQDTLYFAEIQVLDVQDDGDTLSTFSEIQGTASTVDSLIALTVGLVEANDVRDSVSANVTPIPTAPFVASKIQALQLHTTLFGQFADAQEPLTATIQSTECEGEMVAKLYKPDPFNLCNAAMYEAASELVSFSNAGTLQSFELDQNTDYVLMVGTNEDGCAVNIRIGGVAVSIDHSDIQSIEPGESVEVDILGSDDALGFSWSPSDQVEMIGNQTARITPNVLSEAPDASSDVREFVVTGYLDGCAYYDTIDINILYIRPPQAFTPNGDGENDTWKIQGLGSKYPSAKVDVYDRWGQVVHRSVGYAEAWNGKNRRGRDVPTGTYYYVIDLNDPDVELPLVKGYVAILR